MTVKESFKIWRHQQQQDSTSMEVMEATMRNSRNECRSGNPRSDYRSGNSRNNRSAGITTGKKALMAGVVMERELNKDHYQNGLTMALVE